MPQKLFVLSVALFCFTASGMDSTSAGSGDEPDSKKAKIETSSPEESDSDIDAAIADGNEPKQKKTKTASKRKQTIVERQTTVDKLSSAIFKLIYADEDENEDRDARSLGNIQRAMDNGTNINARDEVGETPLFYWAASNSYQVCAYLIKRGADLKVRDNMGNTPLQHALGQDADDELITLLLNSGADANAKGYRGYTPFLVVTGSRNAELFKFFIQHGGNIFDKTNDGSTALHEAAQGQDVEICSLLLDHGQVHGVSDSQSLNINALNNEGQTALHASILYEETRRYLTGRYWQTNYCRIIITLLSRDAHACIIPTPEGDGTNKPRIIAALCTLKRMSELIRLPRDVSYLILACSPDLQKDLLCYLLPYIQSHADNNTLSQSLKGIPTQFHGFVITAIYHHTMTKLKEALAKLNYGEIASIEERFGPMMYQGIMQLLGTEEEHSQATREQKIELFAA